MDDKDQPYGVPAGTPLPFAIANAPEIVKPAPEPEPTGPRTALDPERTPSPVGSERNASLIGAISPPAQPLPAPPARPDGNFVGPNPRDAGSPNAELIGQLTGKEPPA